MSKQKYILLALTDCHEGANDEFNRWYTGTHIPDILSIDRFVAAQRFEQALEYTNTLPQYLAIYEIEASSPEEALNGLEAMRQSNPAFLSGTLDLAKTRAAFFRPVTERSVASD